MHYIIKNRNPDQTRPFPENELSFVCICCKILKKKKLADSVFNVERSLGYDHHKEINEIWIIFFLTFIYRCYLMISNVVITAKPALDWNSRKRIAIGTARGLLYLHEQCDPKIIHRDVKAANVLLDDFSEAVVGDFGLAKLLDHADSHVTTAVRGTVGYIAPEYLSTGQSSEKTDVFGFGVLLLELITGMRSLEVGKTGNQKGIMLEWVSFSKKYSSIKLNIIEFVMQS